MADAGALARVIVVGGTGVFGRRLVAGLLETTDFEVVVAGRGGAGDLAGNERVASLVLDTRTATAEALKRIDAFAVVDAAGPFQDRDYPVARAAIAASLHYVDLADGRDFVAGFGALDAAAKAAGVAALTGASSTPALSNAALDALTADWSRVDAIEIGISPGNRAPRGLSLVRTILAFAGRPVRLFEGGAWRRRPGWGMTVRRRFPGLGIRWLTLVETPDLDLVPERFSVRDRVVFRAGLELSALHLGLSIAALAVRSGLLRSLAPLARPTRALAALMEPLGSDRGGVIVQAQGVDGDGRAVRAEWSLVAEAGDGPFIPTLPALAALRALAAGRIAPGARACVGVLSLAEIEVEFVGRRITSATGARATPASLYETVLGASFVRLPGPVRGLHRPGWGARFSGMARVEGARGRVAWLFAALAPFPPAAEHIPVCVRIVPGPGCERWIREFGGRRMASTLSASGRPGGLVERFGPVAFELDVLVGAAGVLGMPVVGWRLGPLPLPRRLAPISVASETVDDQGRFCFDVELRLPLGLGRLVRYRGWLVADDRPPSPPWGGTGRGTARVEP